MFRWLIRCFLAGFFTILPLVITVAIVLWLGDYINRLFGPGTIIGGWLRSLGSFGSHFATNKTLAYIIGWVIVLGVVFTLGVLIESGARRRIQGLLDNFWGRVPMFGGIY